MPLIEKILLELNRKEILSNVDKTFINHAEYTKDLPSANRSGVRFKTVNKIRYKGKTELELVFTTVGSQRDKVHTQRIIVVGLFKDIKESKGKNLNKILNNAFKNYDLKLGCTGESFKYYGYAYLLTKEYDSIHPKFRENRKPDVRNPKRQGIICKHLDLVLRVLPFNQGKIIKEIKDKIL